MKALRQKNKILKEAVLKEREIIGGIAKKLDEVTALNAVNQKTLEKKVTIVHYIQARINLICPPSPLSFHLTILGRANHWVRADAAKSA